MDLYRWTGKMEDNKQEWRLNLESVFHEIASISAWYSLQEKFSSWILTVPRFIYHAPSSHEKRNNIERKINEPVKASAAVDNVLEIVKK